jgi:hypothetical protein
MASKNVTIRLDEEKLLTIQKVAEMYETSLNGILRDAVDEYLREVPHRPGFEERLQATRRRHDQVFDSLEAAAHQVG